MVRGKRVDKVFLSIVSILILVGLLIFTSASLGLLARTGANFGTVVLKQLLSIFIGCALAYGASKIPYVMWRKWSLFVFIAGILITLLVFIPQIGLAHGGGKRWLSLGPLTFQPAEFLKIAFVIYCAAWLSRAKDKVVTFKGGLVPVLVLLSIVGVILLKQPDTDTFISIFLSAMGMYVVAGGKLRYFFLMILISAGCFFLLAQARPYIMERVTTYLNPASDPQGAGYQIQQSLIAIGSGEMFGRGFGQSIQKFNYLPEPIGDSIFAVAAEEFGFIGGASLIALFLFFTLSILRIATHAPEPFGGLLTVGIAILIVSGSFMNIASMLGVIPLSGLPLLFVSQGGSAMIFTLFQVGIILNISKFRR